MIGNNKKRKIGFIARGLTKGGVTRFIDNLLKEFDLNENYVFYLFTDEESYLNRFKNIKVVYIKKSNKLFWDYFFCFNTLRKNNIDYIIYPKNIIPVTHLLLRSKKFNIIHDLGYFEKELDAYRFLDTLYMKSLMGISCSFADKILAVSEFTKRELIKRFKSNSDKIKVISEAVEGNFNVLDNNTFANEIMRKYNLNPPFIFYCGSVTPRKNILRMLKAFNEIKDKIPHNFYLTGNAEWKMSIVSKYIKENDLYKRVIKIGFVDEDDLPKIYNLADLLLFPSLYEGFGLPILEAQACGCPVLTSNVTSCPEVAGDGAHIVDPYSVDEIRDGILKIIEDNDYKEQLIQKGFENIKRFSWEKSARKILEFI
jgi:glycosyltransferase involved in cell wall biosynthesis